MAITRFDILDTLESVKICTAYKIGNKTINEFPASLSILEKCKPVYEELPGWKTSTCDIRTFKDLPPAAKKYVNLLEEMIGCPANLICVGPERNQTIVKKAVI
jgi:adenylosuccinate synthase